MEANTKALPRVWKPGGAFALLRSLGATGSPARSDSGPEMGVLDRSTSSVQQPDASLSSRSPDRRSSPTSSCALTVALSGAVWWGHCPVLVTVQIGQTTSRASPVHYFTWGRGACFPQWLHAQPPGPLLRETGQLLLWGVFVWEAPAGPEPTRPSVLSRAPANVTAGTVGWFAREGVRVMTFPYRTLNAGT